MHLKLPFECVVICLFGVFSLQAQERFISIDSYKVWIKTEGLEARQPGQPLIVFESGAGTPMGNWERIWEGSAQLGPLIAYDRPGIGKSEPDEALPTIKNVADKLLKILAELKQEPPYLLVGHSLGGVFVRGFAVYYPEKLAGLVIIDPGDFTETLENRKDYYDFLGWEEAKIDQHIAGNIEKRKKRSKDAPQSIKEEGMVLENLRNENFKEFHDHPLPDSIPVHILTGGRFDYPKHLWAEGVDEEALFRSKLKHRVARWTEVIQSVKKGMLFYSGDAGHFVHWDDPELAIASIKIALKDYELMKQTHKN